MSHKLIFITSIAAILPHFMAMAQPEDSCKPKNDELTEIGQILSLVDTRSFKTADARLKLLIDKIRPQSSCRAAEAAFRVGDYAKKELQKDPENKEMLAFSERSLQSGKRDYKETGESDDYSVGKIYNSLGHVKKRMDESATACDYQINSLRIMRKIGMRSEASQAMSEIQKLGKVCREKVPRELVS